jgi:hypothetical protein
MEGLGGAEVAAAFARNGFVPIEDIEDLEASTLPDGGQVLRHEFVVEVVRGRGAPRSRKECD